MKAIRKYVLCLMLGVLLGGGIHYLLTTVRGSEIAVVECECRETYPQRIDLTLNESGSVKRIINVSSAGVGQILDKEFVEECRVVVESFSRDQINNLIDRNITLAVAELELKDPSSTVDVVESLQTIYSMHDDPGFYLSDAAMNVVVESFSYAIDDQDFFNVLHMVAEHLDGEDFSIVDNVLKSKDSARQVYLAYEDLLLRSKLPRNMIISSLSEHPWLTEQDVNSLSSLLED